MEEILQERLVPQRGRRNLRGVKRKMSNFNLRPRHAQPLERIDIEKAIRIIKWRVLGVRPLATCVPALDDHRTVPRVPWAVRSTQRRIDRGTPGSRVIRPRRSSICIIWLTLGAETRKCRSMSDSAGARPKCCMYLKMNARYSSWRFVGDCDPLCATDAPALSIRARSSSLFRQHGPAYRAQFAAAMPASPARVIDAISDCRSAACGTVL